MCALTNTNIAGINFAMTKYAVVLAWHGIDMVLSKSNVNGPNDFKLEKGNNTKEWF